MGAAPASHAEFHTFGERHAAYYLTLAETVKPELRGTHQAVWLARLEVDHGNLRAAIQWVLDQREVELSLRFVGALWRFWWMRGHLSEGRRWLEAALALVEGWNQDPMLGATRPPPDMERRVRHARALRGAGALALYQGDYAAARAYFQASLALMRELGNTPDVAYALQGLGLTDQMQEDYVAARACFQASLALSRELGDKLGIAYSLDALGEVARAQGDYAAGRGLHMESLTLLRKLGDKHGIAYSLGNLGEVARAQGDYAAAHGMYTESLTLRHELDDTIGIAYCLEGLAAVASARDQMERALRLAAAAAAVRVAISAPLPSAEQARFDRWLMPVRQAVSEATWIAAWEVGRAMPLEQAIAEALAGAGTAEALND